MTEKREKLGDYLKWTDCNYLCLSIKSIGWMGYSNTLFYTCIFVFKPKIKFKKSYHSRCPPCCVVGTRWYVHPLYHSEPVIYRMCMHKPSNPHPSHYTDTRLPGHCACYTLFSPVLCQSA